MQHDWVFEVLADMKDYAERHGLIALSAKVDETLEVARVEIGDAAGTGGGDNNSPRQGRN